MIYAAPSATFEAVVQGFPTGLTGTCQVRLIDNEGATATAAVTTGISEYPASSGVYVVTLTAPATAGQYTIVWDTGTLGPSTTATEDLTVTPSATVTISGGWTYDPTTDLGKVRLLIGDTDSTNQLFTDQELNIYVTARGTNYLAAAADACEALATRYARSYDFETDGQSFKRSQMSAMYRQMAEAFRERSGGITTLDITKVDGYSDDILNQTTSTSSSTVNPRRRYYGEEDEIP